MSSNKTIGRYIIEGEIGRGGMAVIYLANDPLMKRNVAIKVLPRQLSVDPDFKTRFERELQVIAALDHPAIVPVFDSGEEDGQPYFVMRYMPGGSLSLKLRSGPLSLGETLSILKRIAPALDEANAKGIIHRDIKPGNILFDQRNDAYLSDFGIVKLTETPLSLTGNNILGTPSYMSPEIAKGDTVIDGKSDLYSLGVLLFRMLTGVVPYTGENPMAIAMKHITAPVPNILEFNPNLPPECASLIGKALAKNKNDRFPSAVDMVNTFQEIINNNQNSVRVFTPASATVTIPNILDIGQQIPIKHPPESNLPLEVSSFIGREKELNEISAHLLNPECRLLTLLGPGGIGKTRLSTQIGRSSIPVFSHGVYFVPLAPIKTPEHIFSTIAEAVNFVFYHHENAKTQLINFLREKNMLLIIDNFEHVLSGVDFISELLENAPFLKFLITSRERLNLQEEWIYQLEGIDFPTGRNTRSLEDYPSVKLFIDRAQKISSSFTPSIKDKAYIAKICQLVEGIPLGIELAAAWIRMLTCEEIANEIHNNLDFLTSSLRNVPNRHRSLRAVFEYSWNLLSSAEKETFCKLSVFQGSFTREAAKEIAGASILQLSALVDKSLLIRTTSGGYVLLEILKQYGHEKLSDNESIKTYTHEKYSKYYLTFITDLEKAILGENQKNGLEKIRANIENIQSGWDWAVENGVYELLNNACESLYKFYEIVGWLHEGLESFGVLSENLSKRHQTNDDLSSLYGRAMAKQGALFYRIGNSGDAQECLVQSEKIFRNSNNEKELAFVLTYLGAVAYLNREYSTAVVYLEESLEINKRHNIPIGTAIVLHHLGLIARENQEYLEAKSRFSESLKVNEIVGNRFGIAISLNNLGIIARDLGNYSEAKDLHQQSLNIRKTIQDQWGIANSLDCLGQVAMFVQNYDEALSLLEQSQEIYREIGDIHRLNRVQSDIRLIKDKTNGAE